MSVEQITMRQLKALPRFSVKTVSGWNRPVSCNTPVQCVWAQVIYTTKAGERKVFGDAVGKTRSVAVNAAWAAALILMNSED